MISLSIGADTITQLPAMVNSVWAVTVGVDVTVPAATTIAAAIRNIVAFCAIQDLLGLKY
jgi:hypothetical protein